MKSFKEYLMEQTEPKWFIVSKGYQINLTGHTSKPYFDSEEAAKEYKKKFKHVKDIKDGIIVYGTSDRYGYVTKVSP